MLGEQAPRQIPDGIQLLRRDIQLGGGDVITGLRPGQGGLVGERLAGQGEVGIGLGGAQPWQHLRRFGLVLGGRGLHRRQVGSPLV